MYTLFYLTVFFFCSTFVGPRYTCTWDLRVFAPPFSSYKTSWKFVWRLTLFVSFAWHFNSSALFFGVFAVWRDIWNCTSSQCKMFMYMWFRLFVFKRKPCTLIFIDKAMPNVLLAVSLHVHYAIMVYVSLYNAINIDHLVYSRSCNFWFMQVAVFTQNT